MELSGEEGQEESQKSLLHQIAPDSLNSHHIHFISQSSHHYLPLHVLNQEIAKF